jgi:hypothetical protein
VFWEAATRDASARPESSTDAYLTKMKERLNAFGDGECLHITDRTLATARIEEFIEEKSLHILLGGKSTGKTKVLESLRKKYDEDLGASAIVVYVDGRKDKLKQGLKNALDKTSDELTWSQGVAFCQRPL